MSYSEDVKKLEKKIDALRPEAINSLLKMKNSKEFSEEVQMRLKFYKEIIKDQKTAVKNIAAVEKYSEKIKSFESDVKLLSDELQITNDKLYTEIDGKADFILSLYLSGAIKKNETIKPLINYHNDAQLLKDNIDKLEKESSGKKIIELAKIKSLKLVSQGKLKALQIKKPYIFKKVEKDIIDEKKEHEIESPETKNLVDSIKSIRAVLTDIKKQYDDKITEKKIVIEEINDLIKPNEINNYSEINNYIRKLNDNLDEIGKEIITKEQGVFNEVLNALNYEGEVDSIKQVLQYKKEIGFIKKIQEEENQGAEKANENINTNSLAKNSEPPPAGESSGTGIGFSVASIIVGAFIFIDMWRVASNQNILLDAIGYNPMNKEGAWLGLIMVAGLSIILGGRGIQKAKTNKIQNQNVVVGLAIAGIVFSIFAILIGLGFEMK